VKTRLKLVKGGNLDVMIPVSPGELLDRLTILEIKSERLADTEQRTNVIMEWSALARLATDLLAEDEDIIRLKVEIRAVNEGLWNIESAIGDHERRRDFGPRFIELARAVYRANDRRAALKRAVNDRLSSTPHRPMSHTA
jgi:hypothetical protein